MIKFSIFMHFYVISQDGVYSYLLHASPRLSTIERYLFWFHESRQNISQNRLRHTILWEKSGRHSKCPYKSHFYMSKTSFILRIQFVFQHYRNQLKHYQNFGLPKSTHFRNFLRNRYFPEKKVENYVRTWKFIRIGLCYTFLHTNTKRVVGHLCT